MAKNKYLHFNPKEHEIELKNKTEENVKNGE